MNLQFSSSWGRCFQLSHLKFSWPEPSALPISGWGLSDHPLDDGTTPRDGRFPVPPPLMQSSADVGLADLRRALLPLALFVQLVPLLAV